MQNATYVNNCKIFLYISLAIQFHVTLSQTHLNKKKSFICNDSHVSIERNMTKSRKHGNTTLKKGSREKAKRYFYRSQKIEIERAFI